MIRRPPYEAGAHLIHSYSVFASVVFSLGSC